MVLAAEDTRSLRVSGRMKTLIDALLLGGFREESLPLACPGVGPAIVEAGQDRVLAGKN